jgi:TonB family protein
MRYAKWKIPVGVPIGLILCALVLEIPSITCGMVHAANAADSGSPQQDRPGVSPGVAEPGVTLTRHGSIIFEADVAAPEEGGSRVLLKENIEIAGVNSAQGWIEFIHAFAGTTARALLDAIPSSASGKKGKVTVGFDLRRDGGLNGAVSVEHSSGNPSIDAAAQLAVAKSAPFGALPQEFANAVAEFRVTFAYNHPHPLPPPSGDAQ